MFKIKPEEDTMLQYEANVNDRSNKKIEKKS